MSASHLLLRVPWLSFVMCLASVFILRLHACTDFVTVQTLLPDAQGGDNEATAASVVSARTMDFDLDLQTVLEVLPRQTLFTELPLRDGFNASSSPSHQWRSKYGFVATNIVGLNVASDGLNEKGLSAAMLYLESTEYPRPQLLNESTRLLPTSPPRLFITNYCSYLLGNYATVDQVEDALKKDLLLVEFNAPLMLSLLGIRDGPDTFPLHLSIHDASGQSLVVEFIEGKTQLHRNPNGVLTNAPTLEWHLTNLKVLEASPRGQVVPGDYTSVSRFNRISMLKKFMNVPYTPQTSYAQVVSSEQAIVSNVAHLLNTVVRPAGFEDDAKRHAFVGATQWSLIRDHTHLKLYFRSTQNQVLRALDLKRIDFSASTPSNRKALSMTSANQEWYQDVTPYIVDGNNTARTNDVPVFQHVRKEKIEPRRSRQTWLFMNVANNQSDELDNTLGRQVDHNFCMGLVVGILGTMAVGFLASSSSSSHPQQRGRNNYNHVRSYATVE